MLFYVYYVVWSVMRYVLFYHYIPRVNVTEHDIKERLWTHFVDKYIYSWTTLHA